VVSPLHSGAWDSRNWWDVGANSSMIRDTRDGAPKKHGWWQGDQAQVGAFLHGYDSLWLPASLLQKDQQKHLAAALFAASRHKKVELHINKGLAGAPPEAQAAARQTATNPAAVEAFALVIIAARSERGFLCFGEQLLQPFLAERILGEELFEIAGHQNEIRPPRAFLRPPRRRQ
jgi:hypothetical protein